MRKAHMKAVIDSLKTANGELTRQRDEVLGQLHAKADAHVTALVKVRADIAGLGEAVRAATHAHPAPAAPAAPAEPEPAAVPVTPIRRRAKTAG